MDFDKKNPEQPQDDGWLDEILGEQERFSEIGPDEQAVSSAGLGNLEDAELDLEKILAEDWDADPQPQETVQENAPEEPEFVEPEEAEEVVLAAEGQPLDKKPESPDKKEKTDDTEEPKSRPKMKKGYGLFGLPHLVSTAIWLTIIVLVGVTLGNTLWLWCADLMAFGKPDQEVSITITDEEVGNIDAITKKLVDAGLVNQPAVFKFFAEITGKQDEISAGTFTLNSSLDYNAMIRQMSPQSPAREIVEDLMIPEGYNCAQIFALLEEKGVCTVKELEEYAANGKLGEYWFLEGVQRGDKYCLEGYLFPDTYDFYTNDDPDRVIEKMLDAFDARFTDKMKADFTTMQERYAKMLASHGYDSDYIASHQLTLHHVVTLASIVQKEMATTAEGYTIASVFYNRLTNQREHPFLGSDATVYYAIGDYFGDKEELTQADLDFDSPYNTRNHQGLPPGPICNPGIYGLYSALDPDESSYYYFIYSKEDGKHLFSKTLAEHEALAEKLGY